MDAQDGGDRMFCVFSFLHLPMHPFSKPLLNTNPVFGTLGHIDSVAGKSIQAVGRDSALRKQPQHSQVHKRKESHLVCRAGRGLMVERASESDFNQ